MPAAVHALLVVRPDGRGAAAHLRRTLEALHAQTRPLAALTIVICGTDREVTELASTSGAEGIIAAPRSTGFAAALRMASSRLTGDAVWVLAQDTAPEPDALDALAAVLEQSPSVTVAAPKLVRWTDSTEIVSLGVSVTRLGRSVDLVDGELDQGQHDSTTDVLGADVRGVLVRAATWQHLQGIDAGLLGADEGLDLGIRARLAGDRVAVAPRSRVAVAGDGVAGLPDGRTGAAGRRRAFARRSGQLHRRLAYAPAPAVPLHWLALLPLALWRTVLHLVGKQPGRVGPEWAATLVALVRLGGIARSRALIRATRVIPWNQLAALRVSPEQLRTRLDASGTDSAASGDYRRGELRFFTGGAAWVVLGALLVSVAAFPALLAWPAVGGGALEPLRATVAQLWADAAYGARASGFDAVGAADPFAAVIAVLGTLWPADPTRVLVWLWLLALPLAVLGGWFATTRLSDRSLVRITGAVAWGLAPTFLAALIDPRPAAVLVHLLLPWLFYTAAVAHRSWASAGAASVLFAAVLACSPSLAPALVVLWLAMLVLVLVARRGRGVPRVIWLVVPAAALAAPLVWQQVSRGNALGLLADPGALWAGPQVAADPLGRALLATGFPTTDPGRWGEFLTDLGVALPTWWVPLFVLPLAVLALAAPLTRRFAAGIALLVVAGLGLASAFAAVGTAVAFSGDVAVTIWPGAALSLAWLGMVGAAVVTLDGGFAASDIAGRRIVSTIVLTTSCVLAIPALTAVTASRTASLALGAASTLPAYVAAEGGGDTAVGTLVVSPLGSGGVGAEVVWGASATLGGESTVAHTQSTPRASDEELARLTADVTSTASADAVTRLAARGISFILLAPAAGTELAGTYRLGAVTALNQRAQLDVVGDTARGTLWRVDGDVTPRAESSAVTRSAAQIIGIAQLAVFAIALLLAIPTAATRRAARETPRVIGARTDAI